ncbi:hypothetical protein [Burkholderia gladioli]|uniref:hypothetical protein n=1 Tax=Burkholderia gladioli TaxID=28095 RepID=UPI002FE05511
MSSSFISGVVSLVLGVFVGFLGMYIKDRFKRKEVKIITINEVGKKDIITAPAGATSDEIRGHVNQALNFEKNFSDILINIQEKIGGLNVRQSKIVDFIVEIDDKKIAIEVKLDPKSVSVSQIERYLAAEAGIQGLIIASPKPFADSLRHKIEESEVNSKVKFFRLSNDFSRDENELGREIERTLTVS